MAIFQNTFLQKFLKAIWLFSGYFGPFLVIFHQFYPIKASFLWIFFIKKLIKFLLDPKQRNYLKIIFHFWIIKFKLFQLVIPLQQDLNFESLILLCFLKVISRSQAKSCCKLNCVSHRILSITQQFLSMWSESAASTKWYFSIFNSYT